MRISPKPKTFSEFLLLQWNLGSILSIVKKKDQSHSLSVTELIDYETGSYRNV